MNESTLVPREEMSDLDWLARNVHFWDESAYAAMCGGVERVMWVSAHAYGQMSEFKSAVTKDQWLARRAELQNKPSWGAVPSHANWLAQDAAGSWLWHSSEPECRNGGWIGSTTRGYSAKGCVLGDWRDTLEKRPDVEQEISYNLNCESFMPFVGVEDAATAKQPAPKGSGNPILGMVLADLTNRALEGKDKYGEPLLAHNGRNPLWDAYQEALDLAMYLRQAIEERK